MKSKAILAAGAAAGAFLATQAAAQDGASAGNSGPRTDAGDIVVTATRREQRLQEVPLAVSAIGSETLQTRGIQTLGDLGSGKVPGLVVTPLFGAESSLQFYIRGFGAGDASQGTQDLPVALYIDGVNFPRAQGAGLDLVTPERIEILRGPQGQLFGRNAHSGAVQIVSKRPTGEWNGDLKLSAGTYSSFQVKGRVDFPEFAGFRVQLSGNFRKHGGYMHNPHNPNYTNVTLPIDPESHTQFKNQDFNGDWFSFKTYGGRIAVERDLGSLNLFYSYDNTWARDDQAASVLYRSDDVGTVFTNFSPTPLGDIVFSNFSGPGGTPVTFTNPLQGKHYPKSASYGIPRVPFINKSQGHILNLTYQASDALTLRSITGRRIVPVDASYRGQAGTCSMR